MRLPCPRRGYASKYTDCHGMSFISMDKIRFMHFLKRSRKQLTRPVFQRFKALRHNFATKITLAHKLALILTLMLTFGMVLLGLVITKGQNTILQQQMSDFGNTVVTQLAESSRELILADDKLSLMVLLEGLSRNENIVGAVIYNDTGQSLVSTGLTPSQDIAALYQANDNMPPRSSLEWLGHNGNSDDMEVVSFFTPIRFQDLTIGHTLVSFSQKSMRQAITETIKAIIMATILMSLLGIFIAWYLGKQLSKPIYHLIDASKAIDSGDYDYRIHEQREDEIGHVMSTMNNAAHGLREKKQVEHAFSRFVSPTVAKQIMSKLDQIHLGGEQVTATVVFADMVDFTSISEKLPPADVAQLLNEYFSYISTISQKYHGTIDKFIGDCAMLVFGAPEKDPDHKFNAIACAVMIQQVVETLNIERHIDGQIPVHFRIGINSGKVLAGNLGAADRMQYTVVGDTVNLAARLQAVAQKGQIIATEALVNDPDIQQRIVARAHQRLEIRGISEPVMSYLIDDIKQDHQAAASQIAEIIKHDVVA